jgi:outer membrane protein assembly factor BamB
MKFRHLVLCTAALAIIFTGFAPGSSALAASSDESGYSKIHPSWSRSFESQVRWQRVTPLGDLLVNTAESLYGVDPLTGEIRWQHPGIGRFNGKSFEMIPDTPFAVISTKKEPSRVVIVDSMDGRIIFDSAKAGIKNVMSRHLLPGRQGILIAGVPNGGTLAGLSMFDATTGEQKWLNENIFKTKRTAMKIASMFLDRSKESKRFNNEAFEINEGAFLFASDLGLFNINSNTGEIIWKVTNYAGADPRIFFSQQKPDMMVVGSKFRNNMGGANETVTALYSAYRISDGQQLWKEPISMNGEVNKVIFHDRGLILSPLTSARAYIKLIDYSTGKSLWGKKGRGIKATGGIVDHVVSGNMMLLTTGFDNAWTNKGMGLRFEPSSQSEPRRAAKSFLFKPCMGIVCFTVGT